MSTDENDLYTSSTPSASAEVNDYHTDGTNTAVISVLIILLCLVVVVNLFALVSILRNCCITTCTLLICAISTVEVFQVATCATTTLYSFYDEVHSLKNNSTLCGFYGWLYIIFRTINTMLVSMLVLDRAILAHYSKYYVRSWTYSWLRWFIIFFILLVALAVSSLPLYYSSYEISPDARNFFCFYEYSGNFAIFYLVFHLVQTAWCLVTMPWVVSREPRVDATLSVILVGEMVVCREGRNVTVVRNELTINRLVSAVVVLYHACSAPLPVLLVLRFLSVSYPALVGLIALQLPTFSALFLPLLYGLMWRPFRIAYYGSVACCWPHSQDDLQTRAARSIVNPVFCENRGLDRNSILHARGLSLTPNNDQDNSLRPTGQTQLFERLQLDPSLLESPKPPESSRTSHEGAPKSSSAAFHNRHDYLMPSKFQNIFEIIDALSAPRRNSFGANSESSGHRRNSVGASSESSVDSLETPRRPREDSTTFTEVKLNDVSVSIRDHQDSLRGVDFSSVHLSKDPSNVKMVNKIKLNAEISNALSESGSSSQNSLRGVNLSSAHLSKNPHNLKKVNKTKLNGKLSNVRSEPVSSKNSRGQSDESLTHVGPVRFTDLRSVIQTASKPETFAHDSSSVGELSKAMSETASRDHSLYDTAYTSAQKDPYNLQKVNKTELNGELLNAVSESGSRRKNSRRQRDNLSSKSPQDLKKVDNTKLNVDAMNETESSSIKYSRRQSGDSVTHAGPIRFTNLRRVQTTSRPETFSCDSSIGNEQRFRKYLPSENSGYQPHTPDS